MKQHRKTIILGVLLFTEILLIGGTISFLTGFDQRVNRLAVGQNTTGITETFPDPGPVSVHSNSKYSKKVWVTNAGGGEEGFHVDCYVRVSLSYSDWDIGQAVVLQNLNTNDWEYRSDGYYYYRKVLKEGQSTTPLFTGFSFNPAKLEESRLPYLSQFTISVYEESVQAAGFSSYDTAWSYYTKPIGNV